MQQRSGISDGALVGAVAAVAAACGGYWLASGIGGFLTHGQWPDISFTGTAAGIRQLINEPGDPMAGWPAESQAQLPSPAVFYAVLGGLVLVFALLAGLAVRIRIQAQSRPAPERSRREQIERALSASAVQDRAAKVTKATRATPADRAPQRGTVRDSGIYLGQDIEHDIDLYGSREDSYCVLGPPRSGKTVGLVMGAVLDAPGAVVVTSTRPDVLRGTKAERERHGPVHVFDPQDLAGVARRLRWAPEHGCADPPTAARRARALALGAAGPVQTVVRCYLHAAAVDGRGIRHLRPWVADPSHAEPTRILRDSSLAADGWADELAELGRLEGDRRAQVWDGVREALAWLSDPRVVDECSPGRTDLFDSSYFTGQQGTLYLIGSASAEPSTAQLVTALVEDVVELGRRVAARSPDGRLDPPLLLMLDDVASAAPLPSLVPLLSEGGGFGLTTVAVLQSVAQAQARWGAAQTAAAWQASTVKVAVGGLAQVRELEGSGGLGPEYGPARELSAPAAPTTLAALPTGQAVVLHPGTGPVVSRLAPWSERPGTSARRTHATR